MQTNIDVKHCTNNWSSSGIIMKGKTWKGTTKRQKEIGVECQRRSMSRGESNADDAAANLVMSHMLVASAIRLYS